MCSQFVGISRFFLLKITCSENSAPFSEGQSIAPNYSSVQIIGRRTLRDCVPEKVTRKAFFISWVFAGKKNCPNENVDLGNHKDGNKGEREQP